MPAGIMAIRPFGLNDVIPVLDDELAVAAVPRRFPPVLDRLAFRPETGHRLIVILPHQVPLPVARLDEIALAIHGRPPYACLQNKCFPPGTVPGSESEEVARLRAEPKPANGSWRRRLMRRVRRRIQLVAGEPGQQTFVDSVDCTQRRPSRGYFCGASEKWRSV